MSRPQRQLLGVCLGVILLLLLYRYHRTPEAFSFTSSLAHQSRVQDATHASLMGKIHPNPRWRNLPVRYPVTEVQKLRTLPRTLPKIQSVSSKVSQSTLGRQASRQSAVKEVFGRCWKSYQSLAWAADELAPISGSRRNELGGWGATLVDNLDTLWIMGMHEDFKKTVAAVARIKFHKTQSPVINTHKVNIHLLGGLLAAFDLSADPKLLEKAIELGDMLYAAFDTPNRMPIIHWDPHRALRREEQLAEESVLGAELGSFILEFTRLSQITGDPKYFDAAQRVMEVFEKKQKATQLPGLWPVWVNARAELFDGDAFAWGAEANSLYKSLPGAHALLGSQTPMYRKMYEDVALAAAGHNNFQPMNPEGKTVLLSGTVRIVKTENEKPQTYLEPQMHYQSCFAGEMFALGGALLNIPIHQEIAHRLVDGCIWAHQVLPMGIMPEVFSTVPCASQAGCPWSERLWKQEVWKSANNLEPEPIPDLNVDTFIKKHRLPKGFTGIQDTAYNLRPEAIESMFTLYRITGRENLLDTAWDMFQAMQNATQAKNGNAAIADVTIEGSQPVLEDSMDSAWMSQTLKYFYLMFSPPELISLDEFVFNAGGHPLRRPKAS
jgi:mannosyl-oligosaccharide alpha-1,2-mannosidase